MSEFFTVLLLFAQTLPVHIDVGTNTDSILEDPFYQGLRQRRDRSAAYDALISEFFAAAQEAYGQNVLIQVRAKLGVAMIPFNLTLSSSTVRRLW